MPSNNIQIKNTGPLGVTGLRPNGISGLDTTQMVQFFVIAIIIVGILILLFRSGFQDYYNPSPGPANINLYPDNYQLYDNNKSSYDSNILRANRYYSVKNGQPGQYTSVLSSITQEMPTTYMMKVLERLKTEPQYNAFNINLKMMDWLNMKQSYIVNNIDILKELFFVCRFSIITNINMLVLDMKLSNPDHPFAPFQIINSRNTKVIFKNPDDSQAGLILVTDFMIHRPYKTHTFNIQATIDISGIETNTKLWRGVISDIRVIGSTIEGDIASTVKPFDNIFTSAPLNNGGPATDIMPGVADIAIGDYSTGSVQLDKVISEYKRSSSSSSMPPVNGLYTIGTKPNTTTKVSSSLIGVSTRQDPAIGLHAVTPVKNIANITNGSTAKYIEAVVNAKCFGVNPETNTVQELVKYNNDERGCISTHGELNGAIGIYDSPCVEDTDCPYFQANKNYPNTFGKCLKPDGICEMPVGAVRVGYKKIHKQSQPRCNNCNILPGYEINTEDDEICCNQQMAMLSDLGLNSPDYRFVGDLAVRKQPDNIIALSKLGLTP